MADLDVASLIKRLQSSPINEPVKMSTSELEQLCTKAIATFQSQPMLLELHAPINVVGDLHGQFADLRRLLDFGGLPPFTDYLFLGDYVDRGRQGLETMALLLCYRVRYPNRFFLLRGNHENEATTMVYGFYDEVKTRFSAKLHQKFCAVFNWMPIAARIDTKIFCVHGGLSPHLQTFADINKIERPLTVPPFGLMCDLLWSDPLPNTTGWSENVSRRISFKFGSDVVKRFCDHFGVEMVIRAHQVPPLGYKFFADNQLLTIFSAPNYMGIHGNDAAFLDISADLNFLIKVLRPTHAADLINGDEETE